MLIIIIDINLSNCFSYTIYLVPVVDRQNRISNPNPMV